MQTSSSTLVPPSSNRNALRQKGWLCHSLSPRELIPLDLLLALLLSSLRRRAMQRKMTEENCWNAIAAWQHLLLPQPDGGSEMRQRRLAATSREETR